MPSPNADRMNCELEVDEDRSQSHLEALVSASSLQVDELKRVVVLSHGAILSEESAGAELLVVLLGSTHKKRTMS